MLSRLAIATFAAGTVLACGAAVACEGKDSPCNAIDDWLRFTSVTMTLSQPDGPPQMRFDARFDRERNDIAVDVDYMQPGMKGTVAMVAGRAMLTKGLALERGVEIDALDAPVLETILVTRLLGRVFPDGPASVPSRKDIDRTDTVAVQYATPSASGRIPAPWHLTGRVAKDGADHLSYDLVIAYPKGDMLGNPAKDGGTTAFRMRGELGVATQPVLRDDMPLKGWVIYGVGPTERTSHGSTLLDYGASPHANAGMKTVADVRAYLDEEFGPGKLDKTKDFTGMWKGKCSDNFGLRIMHYGDEGKYAILFCGPGGCGDPARARLTFITGDKGYEVVSDDEILSGRGADKERYVRCSRELPPLKVVH